jgi:hypothetical protein
MRGIFVFFALAILANQVKAEGGGSTGRFQARKSESQCTPLDVRKSRPSLKEFYETPKNQDRLGWCYASVAAELISHRLGRPVSQVDLAVSYNQDIQASPGKRTIRKIQETLGMNVKNFNGALQGGWVEDALKDARKYGVCPSERITSFLPESDSESDNQQLRTLILALGKTGESLRSGSLNRDQFIQGVECFNEMGMITYYRSYFPGLDFGLLYDVLTETAGRDVNEVFFRLAQKHCEGHRIRLPKIQVMPIGRQNLFTGIDSQLKKGNPVGLGFHAQMMKLDAPRLAGHAATIIARKFIDGECRYLMRNSWGSECLGAYRDELVDYCEPKSGSVWVPESLIQKYMKSATYIK